MKSNNVRMKINRDLHAQFKRVDGDSNDERMAKLLADSKEKYRLIEGNHNLKSDKDLYKKMSNYWLDDSCLSASKFKTLAMALVVSIAVSVCSVAYVCVVNGWFS